MSVAWLEDRSREGERRTGAMYVCVPMCWYVHMCTGSHDSKKRTLDPLGFEAAVNRAGAGAGAGNRAWALLLLTSSPGPRSSVWFLLIAVITAFKS